MQAKEIDKAVSVSEKKLQMNLLDVEKRDWQTNVSIRKKKLQMNLLNVGKRDCYQNEYRKSIFTNLTSTYEI